MTAVALEDHWADGPTTFLGVQTHGFPNLFFPGGPHAAAGNNPRYNGDQVDFITDTLVHARDHGYDVIEVTPEAEERWTAMIDRAAARTPFGTIGQYVGGNIPGKPKRYLLNAAGRPKLFSTIAEVKDSDYADFTLTEGSPTSVRTLRRIATTAPHRRRDHTVAMGVTGEPTMPGRRSGGAVSRKRLRSCSRSQVASSWRYQSSPRGTPSLNRHRWWIGRNEWRLGSRSLPSSPSTA